MTVMEISFFFSKVLIPAFDTGNSIPLISNSDSCGKYDEILSLSLIVGCRWAKMHQRKHFSSPSFRILSIPSLGCLNSSGRGKKEEPLMGSNLATPTLII